MVFDAHVHFWEPATRHHAWLDGHPALNRRFVPEDLEPAPRAAVFVQADCRDDEALDEVRWVNGLADEHDWIQGIVAYAPLHLGAAAAPAVARVAAERRVIGVRRLLQGEPDSLLDDDSLVAGVRLLAGHDLAFDVCVTHEQLPAAARLISACPDVRFVLDHVGKPPVAAGILDPWRDDLARLAALPNVVCKLSGLTTEAGPGWRPPGLWPYLRHALDSFGPERCMVGSDWPLVDVTGSYRAWLDVVQGVLDGLSPPERDAVLHGTAASFYRLTPGSSDASSSLRR